MSVATAAVASPLGGFADRSRVLVISAPTSDDAALREQEIAIRAVMAGMRERDLVVVRVIGAGARADTGAVLDAVQVRDAVGLSRGSFGAVLVGKDGGVKLHSATAIAAGALFEMIDSMPMRQQEIRARR